MTLNAFTSDYTVDTEIAIRPVEIVQEVSIDTLTTADAAKIADLSVKDPALYPLISAINGAVGIPIMFMYQGVFFALAVGLLFLFGKFGHLTIGVVVSLVIIGFATAWGVYDVVMLVILIICGLGLILTQGRQTV
jgi:type IV secretory pathway VirB6-like protein